MNLKRIVHGGFACLVASSMLACTDANGEGGTTGGTGATPSAGNGGTNAVGGGSGTGVGGTGGTGAAGRSQGGSAGASGNPAGNGGTGVSAGNGGGAGSDGASGSGGSTAGAGGSGAGGRGSGGRAGSSGSAGAAGSASGSGGTPAGPPTDPIPSEGCGSATAPDPCDTSGSPCTMDVEGTMREYYVVLPDSYDASKPYPVVFQWHPLGGNAEQGMNMYQIRPNMPDAIYVTPDGLDSGGNQGFPNTGGGDEKMTRAIVADIEAKYCVDKARYFAAGFSYGGSMSFTCACNMSDIFRGIGAMAGAPISGAKCSTTPPARRVAFWATHGTADTALPIDLATPIRDAFVEKNGCSMTTKPVEPSPCVAYDDCADGYPVVWCPREGDPHAIPSFAKTAIPAFFKQF